MTTHQNYSNDTVNIYSYGILIPIMRKIIYKVVYP